MLEKNKIQFKVINGKKIYSSKDASKYIGRPPNTLAWWRHKVNNGDKRYDLIPYHKTLRTLYYYQDDLDMFLKKDNHEIVKKK